MVAGRYKLVFQEAQKLLDRLQATPYASCAAMAGFLPKSVRNIVQGRIANKTFQEHYTVTEGALNVC